MTQWHPHPIDWKELFYLRKPVLEKMLRDSRWQVSADGATLLLDLPLTNYSPHERHIINFALNPYETAQGIFAGLDQPVRESLLHALTSLFGPNGALAGR
jgi:hypothetical protein